MLNSNEATLRDWVTMIFLAIVWGSSFILIKKALVGFGPTEVAALRIGISTIAFVPIFFLLYRQKVAWKDIKWIALIGLLGNGLPAFGYAIAQTHVDSSVAGILNTLTPIFTWVLGLMFFAVAVRTNQLVGVLTGFVGALLIIGMDPSFKISFDPYTLLIVGSTICYGLSANIVKNHLQNIHPTVLSAVAFFCIGPFALSYLLTTDVAPSIMTSEQARLSLLAAATLALVGTVLANILFFRLIQRTTAVFGSSVAYLIPVTALAWGVLDGESLEWTHLVGMVLILIGVYVMRK